MPPHCPTSGSGLRLDNSGRGLVNLIETGCSLNSDQRGELIGSAPSDCQVSPASTLYVRLCPHSAHVYVRSSDPASVGSASTSATTIAPEHTAQREAAMAISRSFVARRVPFVRSVMHGSRQLAKTCRATLVGRSLGSSGARILIGKSHVSAPRDDQQGKKCRNNDRGDEPAHDITSIMPNRTVVHSVRHCLHGYDPQKRQAGQNTSGVL